MSNYTEYQRFVMSRAKSGEDIKREMSVEQAHLLHMAVGLMGEVIELKFHEDEKNFWEELGDIEFYLAGFIYGLRSIDVDMAVHGGDNRFNSSSFLERAVTITNMDNAIDIMTFHAEQILDKTKKIVIYQKEIPPTDFLEHLAEVWLALDILNETNGRTREETQSRNVSKLTERYPTAYSNADANERKDKNG